MSEKLRVFAVDVVTFESSPSAYTEDLVRGINRGIPNDTLLSSKMTYDNMIRPPHLGTQ